MLPDQLIEMAAAEKSNQLTKEACTMYYDLRPSVALGFRFLCQNYTLPRGGHFLSIFSKSVFGQECYGLIAKFNTGRDAVTCLETGVETGR
jgi:hypothetical protein